MSTDEEKKDTGEPKLDNQSMSVILEMVVKEYDAESERITTFEQRTGFMFALSGALATIATQFFVIPGPKTNVLLIGCIFMFETLVLVALLLATFFFLRVMMVQVFQRINPKKYANIQYYSMQQEHLIGTMINSYLMAIDETTKLIEVRARNFKNGLISMAASLIFLVISSLLILIMRNLH